MLRQRVGHLLQSSRAVCLRGGREGGGQGCKQAAASSVTAFAAGRSVVDGVARVMHATAAAVTDGGKSVCLCVYNIMCECVCVFSS